MRGEEFCGKNLLMIYLFCRIEKRLPVSDKVNDMKKLLMNFHQKLFGVLDINYVPFQSAEEVADVEIYLIQCRCFMTCVVIS